LLNQCKKSTLRKNLKAIELGTLEVISLLKLLSQIKKTSEKQIGESALIHHLQNCRERYFQNNNNNSLPFIIYKIAEKDIFKTIITIV
jgi:hypothetical protein